MQVYDAVVETCRLIWDVSDNKTGYAKITTELMSMLDEDPELKSLFEESIKIASVNNPDETTNPVRTLDDYYDFPGRGRA